MSDPVDAVLRMVSEGRITAEEAGPILDALEAAGDALRSADRATATAWSSSGDRPRAIAGTVVEGTPSTLRIEVRDGGRQVVNLRLPLALGRYAMDRIPGLTGEQAARIRDALRHGVRGPILEVDED